MPKTPKDTRQSRWTADELADVKRRARERFDQSLPAPAVPEWRGEPSDDQARTEIARLIVGRCTNCYLLCVEQHWVGGNVGPFCDECWHALAPDPSEALWALVEKWQNATKGNR
jgi:hypothetical protein